MVKLNTHLKLYTMKTIKDFACVMSIIAIVGTITVECVLHF